jgi:uncharacterized membrane protein YgcG
LDLLFGLVARGQLPLGLDHAAGLAARRPFDATVAAAAEASALLRLLLGSRPGLFYVAPAAAAVGSSAPDDALPDALPDAMPPTPPRLRRSSSASSSSGVNNGSSSGSFGGSSFGGPGRDWRSLILARLADSISVRLPLLSLASVIFWKHAIFL